MDDNIHTQAEAQVLADQAKAAGSQCISPTGCLGDVATEPYAPGYFMVNGRSMPDDMDPNYAPMYPNQPYNGNPHMHPGELTLVRIIGQGRWQHPFHEHANHVRVLARDGNLLLSPTRRIRRDPTSTLPAGPLMFTTTTTPGLAMDGIFYWTGRGLNWDAFGHGYPSLVDSNTHKPCVCGRGYQRLLHRQGGRGHQPRRRTTITSGAAITPRPSRSIPSGSGGRGRTGDLAGSEHRHERKSGIRR